MGWRDTLQEKYEDIMEPNGRRFRHDYTRFAYCQYTWKNDFNYDEFTPIDYYLLSVNFANIWEGWL